MPEKQGSRALSAGGDGGTRFPAIVTSTQRMAMKEIRKPTRQSSYDGISVGISTISMSLSVQKRVREWEYVRIFCDVENKTILFRKEKRMEGVYKVGKHSIGAKIHREISQGRYEFVGITNDEIIFKAV